MPRRSSNPVTQLISNGRKGSTNRRRNRRQQKVGDFQVSPTAIIPAPQFNQVVRSLTRTIDAGPVFSTSVAHGLYGFSFKFSDIIDYSSFTATFDQYRIDKIDFEIRGVTLPASPSSAVPYSLLAAAVDFDSASAPVAFTDILQYSNVIALTPGQSYTMTFNPRILTNVTVSAASQEAVSKGHAWLSLLNPDVVHYGVRLAVKQSTSTSLSVWYIFLRYHFSLRSSR